MEKEDTLKEGKAANTHAEVRWWRGEERTFLTRVTVFLNENIATPTNLRKGKFSKQGRGLAHQLFTYKEKRPTRRRTPTREEKKKDIALLLEK